MICITDCRTEASFRYFDATSITSWTETSFWEGVISMMKEEKEWNWWQRTRTIGAGR